MSILFCHGLESDPHGAKYQALRAAGLEVRSPDCRKKSLGERVEVLTALIVEHRPRLVVGSSYGGIGGLLASLQAKTRGVDIEGLLLCAPALAHPNPDGVVVERACPAPTIIVHGTGDTICPIGLSRAFAQDHGATLVEVDDGHRLKASLDVIVQHTMSLLPQNS